MEHYEKEGPTIINIWRMTRYRAGGCCQSFRRNPSSSDKTLGYGSYCDKKGSSTMRRRG
jgi:hypothetical protein